MKIQIKSFRIPFKVYLLILMIVLIAEYLMAQPKINEDKYKALALIELAEKTNKQESIEIGILGENYNLFMNLNKLIEQRNLGEKIKITRYASDIKVIKSDILYITSNNKLKSVPQVVEITISKYLDTPFRMKCENGKSTIERNTADEINRSAS